jgi:sialate O-acetylesterase
LIIYLRNAQQGFTTTDNKPPTLFEIAGNDKVFHNAVTKVDKDKIKLVSEKVSVPVAARLGWSTTQVTNLRSSNGLPVSVFRTYNWADEPEDPGRF